MTQTATTSKVRTVDGLTLPTSATFDIDAAHTHVGFVVRHMMVSKVHGEFGTFTGAITVAEDPADSSVEVTIDAASVDTRESARDEHLRSADFFDVGQFPNLTFRSTQVSGSGQRWTVLGDLTIHGVTQPVALEVDYDGVVQDPWGGQRIGFSARTEVDREAFGLTYNAAIEAGGFVVGKRVTIELEVEAVRRA